MATDPAFSTNDLIQHLCLEAGRFMEDASVELAVSLPASPEERSPSLDRLQRVAADISALAAAAQALHRGEIAKRE